MQDAQDFIAGELDRLFQVERNYRTNIAKHLGYVAEAERRLTFAKEMVDVTAGFGDELYWKGKVDAYSVMLATLRDEL